MSIVYKETDEFIIYMDKTPKTFHQYQKFLKEVNGVEFTEEELVELFGEIPPSYARPTANPMLRYWVSWSMWYANRNCYTEQHGALVFDWIKHKLARLNGNNYACVIYKVRK